MTAFEGRLPTSGVVHVVHRVREVLLSSPRTAAVVSALPDDVEAPLRIFFVGPHNTGKSTLISALTGDRAIARSAVPETAAVVPYTWRDVQLYDTPGWFSGVAEHDLLADKELRRNADILVFVITPQLGGSEVVERLDDVLSRLGFAGRAVLAVNKANIEDHDRGLVDAEVRNRLGDHPDVPVVWTDAQDHLTATDTTMDLTNEDRQHLVEDGNVVELERLLAGLCLDPEVVRSCAVEAELGRLLQDGERAWSDAPDEAARREVVAVRQESLAAARLRVDGVVQTLADRMAADMATASATLVALSVVGDASGLADSTVEVEVTWHAAWEAADEALYTHLVKEFEDLDEFATTLVRSELMAEAVGWEDLLRTRRKGESAAAPGLLDGVPDELPDRLRESAIKRLREFAEGGSKADSPAYEWARRLQPKKKFAPHGRLKDAERLTSSAKKGEKLLSALPVITDIGGGVWDHLEHKAAERAEQKHRAAVEAALRTRVEARRQAFVLLATDWLDASFEPLLESLAELAAPLRERDAAAAAWRVQAAAASAELRTLGVPAAAG